MDRKLKFCMVTTFYPPYHFGGDATHIYRLTNELAKRGHRVDVIHCVDAYRILEPRGPKARYENHPNVTVYSFRSPAGFLSPFLTQQTGRPFFKNRKIKTLIENSGYHVIHYHNMSLIGISTLRYGNAIKLYTTNEHWLICPMHVLWKFNRKVCDGRDCLVCMLRGKRPPQVWRYTGLMDKMLKHVDLFISPSRFTMQKHLEERPGMPMVHIPYFLPKGNNHSRAGTTNYGPMHHRPYFLFVGRLEKIKGLQNIIPIFKKYQHNDLLIAGEGNYGETLREIAGEAPNIHFLGLVHLNQLHELYRQATALIVPSICYEVFGIIMIESFAVKTPVIVNNLGPMPEVIEESGGGFVYNNERELVGAMNIMAKNPDLRNDMGDKGYRAFLKYWCADAHMAQYFRLINRTMRQKAKRVSA